MRTKIYPTITAISGNQNKKIEEAEELGISKICVFFSPLNKSQRKNLYKELENSTIKEIPFAHIRGDFSKEEIYYLKEKWKTKIFNIHSANQHPILFDYGKLKKDIYIENTMTEWQDNEIIEYGGLCLDVSHLENDRLSKNKRYPYFKKILKSTKCQCGHISAIKDKNEYCPVAENKRYDKHVFDDFDDFNYLKRYKDILPPIMAMELENPLKEQLEAIDYIYKLLK